MKPAAIAAISGVAGLGIGLTVGFGAGVLSTKAGESAFKRLVAIEESPDVEHPKRLERPGFTLDYPGNWRVKPANGKDDPDHVVTLESAGGEASVVFIVMDAATNAQDNVELQRSQLTKKVLTAASSKPFADFGRYHGEGLELEGKLLGVAPGLARIFSTSLAERSFVAVEVRGENPLHGELQTGLDLIERTFVLRPR